MKLDAGQTILPYRLIEKIGEGGMGVVWKATDTTLNRQAAIKILPDVFTSDPDRVSRFEREARFVASLNHPNVAGCGQLVRRAGAEGAGAVVTTSAPASTPGAPASTAVPV